MNANQILIRFLVQSGFLNKMPGPEVFDNKNLEGPLACLEKHKLGSQQAALTHLSTQLQLQICNLAEAAKQKNWAPQQYTTVLGNDFCWEHRILPYKEDENSIFVACVNPFQEETKQLIEFYLQKNVVFELCYENDLKVHLHNYASSESAVSSLQVDSNLSGIIDVNQPTENEQDSEAQASSQPVIQLCNRIISEAIEKKASDIHIEPSDSGLDIRYRILGSMVRVSSVPKQMQPYVLTRFKILSHMNISERRKPQDGRMRAKIKENLVDIRVSSIPTAHGEKIVMRLLNASTTNLELADLGMPEQIRIDINDALNARGRMLLVTGPTGSGKTTTLYACLKSLENRNLNIVTIEDPIEYRMRGINQIQVNEAAGVTFASALRSILRQDPDVIMLGEIRDLETATIAMQAAQTGHLVLSTLHTNDAPSTIRRLEQLGVPNYLIAASLGGILAQRLVRTVCSACSTQLNSSDFESAVKTLTRHGVTDLPTSLVTNKGCSECNNTGFTGRIGVYSYLKVNQDIENLICDQSGLDEIIIGARNFGFKSLGEGALELLKTQKTTLAETLPTIIADANISSIATNKDSHAAAILPEQNYPVNTISPDKLSKTKILLVEDDSGLRQVLSMLLEKEMFEVIQAENGQDGLEKLYESSPQIVLCDLMMPVMDGREFLTRLKKNGRTQNIPILMLTAADDEANEIDLLELGADDFISKASSAGVMLSRIRKVASALR